MATNQKNSGGKLSNRKKYSYYIKYVGLQKAINVFCGDVYSRCEDVFLFCEDVEEIKSKIEHFYGDYMHDFMIRPDMEVDR